MDEFIWTERYRPKTIDDTVLPAELKELFQKFIAMDNIPNLILSGGAGVGKTTVARAMLEELDCDYIIINGSMNGNIDTLRNDIATFASSLSFKGKRKYVILDEADYLNPNSTQPALRNFMEEFSRNCGFILTCNYKNRIIEPLHSRCSTINFDLNRKDKVKIAMQFMKRLSYILDTEGVSYDKKVIAELINKHFPDFRRIINETQRYSINGSIDSGILANIKDFSIGELIPFLKDKNFSSIRNWVITNSDKDYNTLYREFYDSCENSFDPANASALILLIAKYQYQSAFAADPEINFMGFLCEVMIELEFK